ncbi:MAG: hypothetical protein EOM50_07100 [Erysipelotrichia bacterium]|nr:hypothetical protein [Erysipelotrichia bacterium]
MIIKRCKEYAYKIVKSGNITEVYAYQETLVKTKKTEVLEEIESELEIQQEKKLKIEKKKNEEEDEQVYFRKQSNIARTRKELKRLIYANLGQYDELDKFITLTFKGECPTREQVIKEFREFKRRFTYHYGKKFEYIGVIEKGERGTKRLHIHLVVFGLPYIKQKDLKDMWKNGIVDIKKVHKMGDVAEYLVKYVHKTLNDSYIPKGKNFYFRSKNVKKPTEYYLTDDEMTDFLEQVEIGNPLYNFSFDSEYVGMCNYTKFIKID